METGIIVIGRLDIDQTREFYNPMPGNGLYLFIFAMRKELAMAAAKLNGQHTSIREVLERLSAAIDADYGVMFISLHDNYLGLKVGHLSHYIEVIRFH